MSRTTECIPCRRREHLAGAITTWAVVVFLSTLVLTTVNDPARAADRAGQWARTENLWLASFAARCELYAPARSNCIPYTILLLSGVRPLSS
jgi:hypothetical protein